MAVEEYEVGKSVDRGGKFLDQPGCYHMIVTELRKPAVTDKGDIIENGLCCAHCTIAAPEDRQDKTFNLVFFNPKLDARDGGDFGRKKIDRFLIAVGLVKPEDVGTKVKFDWSHAVGRQFLVRLDQQEREIKQGKNRGEKKPFLDIAFADIFHVDDPDAGTDYPRNLNALKMIPKAFRRTADTKTPPKSVDDMDI